jgi:predicted RNA-binding Zn-ribbon protein involved in translation (DUF1610 family)
MAKAKELMVGKTEDLNLRYAALELRMCMEFLTYEKLRSYSDVIPASVLATWQPPQAVKALLEFEPRADQTFTLHIGKQDGPGQPAKDMHYVGTHATLPFRWLRKHYNKLGKLLHAPMDPGTSSLDTVETLIYLREVVADLEAPLNSNIPSNTLRETWTFTCNQCSGLLVRNAESLRQDSVVACSTPGCGAEYQAELSPDGDALLKPMLVHFECLQCRSDIAVFPKKLSVGARFMCDACGKKHDIVGHVWRYAAVNKS